MIAPSVTFSPLLVQDAIRYSETSLSWHSLAILAPGRCTARYSREALCRPFSNAQNLWISV